MTLQRSVLLINFIVKGSMLTISLQFYKLAVNADLDLMYMFSIGYKCTQGKFATE